MEQPGLEDGSNRRYENGVFSGERNNDQVKPHTPPLHNYNRNNYLGSYYQDNTKNFSPVKPLPEQSFSQMSYYRKDKTDHSVIILSVSAAVIMLLTAFFLTVFLIDDISGRKETRGRNSVDMQENIPYTEDSPYTDFAYPAGESGDSPDYYMELEDAIRTDLDYFILWENYNYEENDGNIGIEIDYPVINGDAPNKDILNDVIADEKVYFEEYIREYSKYMQDNEYFYVYAGGYVTYMDEEIMSVVFSEEIYTDYWQDYQLYCINIDMENGVVISNGSILRVNDDFLQAFRDKSEAQNGGALDEMSDQDIMYYLTEGNMIIFYTPLGMEVGMNYDDGFLTVTFEDYKPYMEKY